MSGGTTWNSFRFWPVSKQLCSCVVPVQCNHQPGVNIFSSPTVDWNDILFCYSCLAYWTYIMTLKPLPLSPHEMRWRPDQLTRNKQPQLSFLLVFVHTVCIITYQYKCPQRVTTGSDTSSKQTLHSNAFSIIVLLARGRLATLYDVREYRRTTVIAVQKLMSTSSSLWDSFTWEQVSYHLLWFDFVGSDTWSLWMFV